MSIRRTHQRTRVRGGRSTVLTAAGLGLLLLTAGCDTGGTPQDPPTDDPGGDPSEEPSDDPSDDPSGSPAELADWVEVPSGAILVASTPGTAVLAVGEPDQSDGTRDVAAYDPAGEELWTHPGVIEDYYQPTTMRSEEHTSELQS